MATRICDRCNVVFTSGYCIDNGDSYLCEGCKPLVYSDDEWAEMYADGEGDSYWSDWSEAEEDEDDATSGFYSL